MCLSVHTTCCCCWLLTCVRVDVCCFAQLPPISKADFDEALKAVRPSSSKAVLDRVNAWAREFGTMS